MYNLWVDVRFLNKNILVIKDYSSEELGALIFNEENMMGEQELKLPILLASVQIH